MYLCAMNCRQFRILVVIWVALCALPTSFYAQTATNTSGEITLAAAPNPFEIQARLPKTIREASSGGKVAGPVNPFDVVAHRAPGVTLDLSAEQAPRFQPFSIFPKGGGMQNATLVGILLALIGFLTFSVSVNRGSVGKAWRGFMNDGALTLLQREAYGLVGLTPYYLLYVNFLLNAAFFTFLVTRYFSDGAYNNFRFLLFCLLGAVFVFLFKHVLLEVVRRLYPVEKEVQRYSFLILVFNCVLGLFLLPFNLVLTFSPEPFQAPLMFWTLGLISVFYTYRALRALLIGSKFLSGDLFHFLLYLCTVEAAPVLFLIKTAQWQAN
jgi:hypothetical protein